MHVHVANTEGQSATMSHLGLLSFDACVGFRRYRHILILDDEAYKRASQVLTHVMDSELLWCYVRVVCAR